MAKINITINDELLENVELLAKKMYLSKSGLIALSLTQFINQNTIATALTDMSITMRKIADEGKLDQESITQLEDFERILKLVLGGK